MSYTSTKQTKKEQLSFARYIIGTTTKRAMALCGDVDEMAFVSKLSREGRAELPNSGGLVLVVQQTGDGEKYIYKEMK